MMIASVANSTAFFTAKSAASWERIMAPPRSGDDAADHESKRRGLQFTVG
jgi:hypothetical protein